MPSSIVADFVHGEETIHEKRVGGLSMASLSFLTKFAVFVPMAIAFPIFGALGIGEAEIVTSTQTFAIYAGIPLILRLFSIISLRRYI
jgi:Na+/melibiose symporter-like transporter